MRALQLTEWGHTANFQEVDTPEPGAGQVLVRIGGAGACHSDLHLMHEFAEGMLPWHPPFTLGHENAGWVEATGAGVDHLEVGQPVAVYGPWGCGTCLRCRQGMENYCEHGATASVAGGGLGADGGMAPFMLVPKARHLVPLDSLAPIDAAPLTDAGLTPYHAVKRSLALLGAGSVAVVIGAGGLGHMAVQVLAACTPALVVAVDRDDDALALVREVGANHTVTSGPEAAAEIDAISQGRGADVVIDFVGADDTLTLAALVTRPLGHVTLVGLAGGSLALSFFSPHYEVSVASTYWGSLPELMEVLALAERGQIRAHVQAVPLDDALEAYASMRAGTLRGRAVIVP